MLDLIGPINSGEAAGSAGSATATGVSGQLAAGIVYAVCVKYNGTVPATADVTVRTKGTAPHALTNAILTLTNANTDGWFYPRAVADSLAGADITGSYIGIPIYDLVEVVLAGADPDNDVDVWLIIGDR